MTWRKVGRRGPNAALQVTVRVCLEHGVRGLVCVALGYTLGVSNLWAEETKIVFGGEAAYPPFEWNDRGTPRGFNIELEQAIAEAGGVEVEHRLGDWSETIRALEAGDVDVVPMFFSEQRERSFVFTPPFQFVSHGIYAREGTAHISSVDDLAGSHIAVERASYAHQYIEAEGLSVQLVLTPNTLTALQAVADGRAEYAALAAPTANYLIRARNLALNNVGPPLWPRSYAFAVRKDRIELAEWLTQRFYEVLRTGAYQQVYGRWEDQLALTEEGTLARVFGYATLPATVLALLGLVWAWRLRGTVLARTRSLVDEVERRRDAEAQARRAFDYDAATGLPRLHYFSQQVDALLTRANSDRRTPPQQVVALKLADVDRTIRTFGHGAGRDAVRAFADHLSSMNFAALGVSGRDVFFAFGESERIASKLRRMASPSDTLVLGAHDTPRLFAGAATWPQHGRTLEQLLRRTETALAVAVEKRQGWVEYRSSMEPDEEALKLIDLFRKTAGAGLYPVYQPQMDIRSGQLVGAEALARWDAQGVGPVPPRKFIPLLEDAGLVRHVTTRMVREAVRVAAELRRRGTPCPISVNVSVTDLLGDKLQKTVFEALRTHDGKAGDLKLELTETSVAERSDAIQGVITRLRESGIRTSIDDFGTGYSSLSYLSDFPVQEVKIDRSFVKGMVNRPQDKSIVDSTIAMAHALRLLVVAEGVEHATQLDMLRAAGCDRAQGFLISKPLKESEFADFVRTTVIAHLDRPRRARERARRA